MKKVVYSALVAIVAVSSALAGQAKQAKKPLTTYYETPAACSSVDCSPTNSGPNCNTKTLFSDPDCQTPVTPSGRYLDI